MGTNFYVKGHKDSWNPQYHLGKRSAAGPYCWDCGVTLCKEGEEGAHHSQSNWYDECPNCGKKYKEGSISSGSVGRELGFNTEPYSVKTGVQSCSSFSWARKLGRVQKIVDEYGREYTREQFEEMLKECPIQYVHMMGIEFC